MASDAHEDPAFQAMCREQAVAEVVSLREGGNTLKCLAADLNAYASGTKLYATPPAATPVAPGEVAAAAKRLRKGLAEATVSDHGFHDDIATVIRAALSNPAPVAAPASEAKPWLGSWEVPEGYQSQRKYDLSLMTNVDAPSFLGGWAAGFNCLYNATASEAGAGAATVAYLLTRPSGFAWVLMPKDITPETREVFEADGATIEPLCRARLAGDSADAPVQQAGNVGLLGPNHTGMRVDYQGLLGQCQRGLRNAGGHAANAEMLRQLTDHLKELGQRWYAGDTSVVDEILQLYCIEKDARAALKGEQPVERKDGA